MTAHNSIPSADVSAAEAKHPGRLCADDFRAVLLGEVDSVATLVPAGKDPDTVKKTAQALLRQFKDRAMQARLRDWPVERETATRVYLDPNNERRLVCDASNHQPGRGRIYDVLLRLPVGESVEIEHKGTLQSVYRSVSALQRQVLIELGYRVKFRATEIGINRVSIKRLDDDPWLQVIPEADGPEHFDTLEDAERALDEYIARALSEQRKKIE